VLVFLSTTHIIATTPDITTLFVNFCNPILQEVFYFENSTISSSLSKQALLQHNFLEEVFYFKNSTISSSLSKQALLQHNFLEEVLYFENSIISSSLSKQALLQHNFTGNILFWEFYHLLFLKQTSPFATQFYRKYSILRILPSPLP